MNDKNNKFILLALIIFVGSMILPFILAPIIFIVFISGGETAAEILSFIFEFISVIPVIALIFLVIMLFANTPQKKLTLMICLENQQNPTKNFVQTVLL